METITFSTWFLRFHMNATLLLEQDSLLGIPTMG